MSQSVIWGLGDKTNGFPIDAVPRIAGITAGMMMDVLREEVAGWTVAALSDEGFPGNGTIDDSVKVSNGTIYISNGSIDDSVKVSGNRGIGGERWMGKRKNGGGGGEERVGLM